MAILILKRTSILLGADASYLLALIAHERAERAMDRWQHDPGDKNRLDAGQLWKSAAEAWQRYLDNFPELRDDFRDRDRQARQLRDQCQASLQPLSKK